MAPTASPPCPPPQAEGPGRGSGGSRRQSSLKFFFGVFGAFILGENKVKKMIPELFRSSLCFLLWNIRTSIAFSLLLCVALLQEKRPNIYLTKTFKINPHPASQSPACMP